MNAKVIAFAAGVALVLIGQSVDIAGVEAILAGAPAPGAEAIAPRIDKVPSPYAGVALGPVVTAPAGSICGGVAQILPGLRAARTANAARPALPANAPARCA